MNPQNTHSKKLMKEINIYFEYIDNLKSDDISPEHEKLIEITHNLIDVFYTTIEQINKQSNERKEFESEFTYQLLESIDVISKGKATQLIDTIEEYKDDFTGIIKKTLTHQLERRTKLEKLSNDRVKGGQYSPYRDDEPKILLCLQEYQSSLSSFTKKQTQEMLKENIEIIIGKKVNLDAVKKWLKHYKSSRGKTIYKKGTAS